MKHLSCLLLALTVLTVGAGCAASETKSATLSEILDRTVQSSKFTQTVTITSGGFILAEEVAIYARGADGAEMSYTAKTLTDEFLSPSLYETTTYSAAVTETDYESAAMLFFDETAATTSQNEDGSIVLSATDPAAFLCMQDAAGITDAVATVALEYERPVSCRVTYTLPSANSVIITFAFTY